MTNKSKGILCIIASAFGFALMAACVRGCDDFGPPISCFQKSFFRNFVALLLAVLVFARTLDRKSFTWPDRKSVTLMFTRSLLGTIGIFANFYALSHITIAEGQTLNKTSPFFAVLFSWIFLKEPASRKQISLLLLAFGGVLLITKPGFAGADAFPLAMGLLGGCAAGSAYAAVHALGRRQVPSTLIVLFFSVFSCLASIPFFVTGFTPMTLPQILILLGSGVGAAIGQFGITSAYRFAAPREIAVYDYSNILFTALFGFALFDQIPDALSIGGFLAILAAALLMHAHARR